MVQRLNAQATLSQLFSLLHIYMFQQINLRASKLLEHTQHKNIILIVTHKCTQANRLFFGGEWVFPAAISIEMAIEKQTANETIWAERAKTHMHIYIYAKRSNSIFLSF